MRAINGIGFGDILSPIGVPVQRLVKLEASANTWVRNDKQIIANDPPWLEKILKLTCLEWQKIILKSTLAQVMKSVNCPPL